MHRQKKLKCLDLFSGIGGNALALRPICKTIAYCEIDPFARDVLEANMKRKNLDKAPIFPDVTKLKATDLPALPDVITASFPCQDISLAGKGAGITGDRSNLYIHIIRLVREIRAQRNHKVDIVLMENSPMIVHRGLPVVVKQMNRIGYTCKWIYQDAASIGAKHLRRRWFMMCTINASSVVPREILSNFDFEKLEDIPRLVGKGGGEFKRLCALGNAVVPLAVSTAWNKLMGYSHRISEDFDPQTIMVYPDRTVKSMWPTPLHNLRTWTPYPTFDGRRFGMLSVRVFHEKDTKLAFGYSNVKIARTVWMINPMWVEALMGYPDDWTKHLD